MIEYISFGGGPPSVAMAILNSIGYYGPKADAIIFADTGAEKARTYELMPFYESYFSELGYEWINVQCSEGQLTDYILNKSVVIPVHAEKGLGHRQCTDQWKIRTIRAALKERFGTTEGVAHLAMTWDEALRSRDSKYKDTTNRFPLIERRVTRAAAVAVIEESGLPLPPWSACYFCPLQTDGVWRQLAAEHPDDFAKAVELDAQLAGNKWLHWSRQPLESVYNSGQMSMFDPTKGGCESGHCFT